MLPNHVYVVASLPKGMNGEQAVRLLKGASSRKLFQVKGHFALRYPRHHFCSRGYFAHTVGVTDMQTQVDYMKN